MKTNRRTRRHPVRAAAVETLETRLLMARLTGIDVSHFQGTMNWNTAASQGIKFAFIRASRTDTLPDNQLANNMHPTTGAKAKGLVVGVYHRILPFGNTADTRGTNDANYVEPETDATNYYNSGANYMGNGYMRPVVDVENGATLNTTPHVNPGGVPTPTTNLSQWVARFVTKLKQLWAADHGGANVNPIMYSGHYRDDVDSSVRALMPDLWIANWETATYGDPVNGSGSPPISPYTSWKFWQYDSPNGKGAQYGAGSVDIDLDVFNGSDINVLKQNFVTGAAAIPSGPSPANGASNVSPLNLTLNWNDSANATAYDVYVDGVLRASNLATSQWTVSPNLAGGAHTWRVVAKGIVADDDTHTTLVNDWSFTASSLPLPGTPSGGTPNGTIQTTKPFILDWADTPNASTYDVYLGTAANLPLGTPSYTGLTSSQSPSISPPTDSVRQWRVVARNATGDTNGPLWTYTLDTTAPTATYGAQTPTSGNTSLTFTVTYSDATSGVDFTSIDSNDVLVSGPNGYSQSASLVSVDINSNGSPRVATYSVAAPGGTWDAADNGSYTVNLNASQVKDVGGLFASGMSGNTFNVSLADPFAYQVGSTLHLDFSKTGAAIGLSYSAGTYAAATAGESTLEFTGVSSVMVHGTADADVLTVNDALPATLDFANGGAGDDLLEVADGAQTYAADLGVGAPNLMLKVDAGASVTLGASQHLRSLSVSGTVALTPGGAKVLVTKALSFGAAAGKLDLADNDLVIDYTGPTSPLGSSTGGVYSGVAGMIQSAFNFGAWDGASGITTTQADALGGLTTLGVGEANTLLGVEGSDTALFGNETVDGTAVLVKYTYAGDANLDGFISGDDYAAIDFNVASPGSDGFFNGDFNYDGLISGDDYAAIDFNITAQGTPL